MKSVFVLIIIFLSYGFSFSQYPVILKGGSFIGGQISYTQGGGEFYKIEDKDVSFFELDVDYYKLNSKGISFGAQVLFQNISIGNQSLSSIGIGPQLSYYLWVNEEKDFYPFVTTSLNYFEIDNSEGGGSETVEVRFGGGVLHLLTNNIGLFIELSYDKVIFEKVDGFQFNVFGGLTILLSD